MVTENPKAGNMVSAQSGPRKPGIKQQKEKKNIINW